MPASLCHQPCPKSEKVLDPGCHLRLENVISFGFGVTPCCARKSLACFFLTRMSSSCSCASTLRESDGQSVRGAHEQSPGAQGGACETYSASLVCRTAAVQSQTCRKKDCVAWKRDERTLGNIYTAANPRPATGFGHELEGSPSAGTPARSQPHHPATNEWARTHAARHTCAIAKPLVELPTSCRSSPAVGRHWTRTMRAFTARPPAPDWLERLEAMEKLLPLPAACGAQESAA